MDRIKELIETLNKASRAYYDEDKEIMSNFEYDTLYDELEKLEKETGIKYPNSPTINVGYTVLSNLEKVKHESAMLSLDKTKEIEKLVSFAEDKESILSWKLDGLTIVLIYEEGNLKQAVTRGNGVIGEDVTHNAKVFKNVPLTISYKEKLTIRGEAVITYSEFEKINELLEEDEKYKNPRNLCSGTVRQLNSEVAAKRNVHFFAFSLLDVNEVDFKNKKSNQLDWLNDMGFQSVEYKIVDDKNIEDTIIYFKNKIPENDFASDGLVVTYDDIEYSESLGTTSKFPKDSIAFKWADEVRETTLVDILWSTSRTGLINPIAIFESVDLEGTTVNKASLHNISIMEGLEMGIGDTITVYKANMIIPQVLDNLTRTNNIVVPEKCPVCDGTTRIIQQKDVKALYCTNPNCRAKLIMSLAHFTSRDAMNIEGLSESTLEKFVANDYIKNYLEIFYIEKYEEQIKEMEGFGVRSYEKLLKSIEKSKTIELPNLIYSLGISQVGLSNARLLCAYFEYDVEKILNAKADDLIKIDGYGNIISESIEEYFHNDINRGLFNKFLEIINIIKPEITTSEKVLSNKAFVITGSLEKFSSRKELEKIIMDMGGKVTSSVTKKTDYLINNDLESASSKNKKANELNIPIIDEQGFIEIFEIEGVE